MATLNRADTIKRLHKVLKKHFTPVPIPGDRSVMEHLLFACCLEDVGHALAEESFARVQPPYYFDWNETRVTTQRELSEVFAALPNAMAAATRLKTTLQSIFETFYVFDLEPLKKMKLGDAQAKLAALRGPTNFGRAYVTQASLGGHAIPLAPGALKVLELIGAASAAEVAVGAVPGLERAIPKNLGIEFGSLLHTLGAQLMADPKAAIARTVLAEVSSEAADRLAAWNALKPAARAAECAALSAAVASRQRKPQEAPAASDAEMEARPATAGRGKSEPSLKTAPAARPSAAAPSKPGSAAKPGAADKQAATKPTVAAKPAGTKSAAPATKPAAGTKTAAARPGAVEKPATTTAKGKSSAKPAAKPAPAKPAPAKSAAKDASSAAAAPTGKGVPKPVAKPAHQKKKAPPKDTAKPKATDRPGAAKGPAVKPRDAGGESPGKTSRPASGGAAPKPGGAKPPRVPAADKSKRPTPQKPPQGKPGTGPGSPAPGKSKAPTKQLSRRKPR